MAWLTAVALALVVAVSSPALAAKRIDLYDAHGHHVGYALAQHRAGRVDYYDLRDRRTGWGQVNSFSDRYRVDLFAADGLPVGYAIVDLDARRVEFFDYTSRPLGSGILSKTGPRDDFRCVGSASHRYGAPVSDPAPGPFGPAARLTCAGVRPPADGYDA
jgi:hypothetical protein